MVLLCISYSGFDTSDDFSKVICSQSVSHTKLHHCRLCDCSLITTINWWETNEISCPFSVSATKFAAARQGKQI